MEIPGLFDYIVENNIRNIDVSKTISKLIELSKEVDCYIINESSDFDRVIIENYLNEMRETIQDLPTKVALYLRMVKHYESMINQ